MTAGAVADSCSALTHLDRRFLSAAEMFTAAPRLDATAVGLMEEMSIRGPNLIDALMDALEQSVTRVAIDLGAEEAVSVAECLASLGVRSTTVLVDLANAVRTLHLTLSQSMRIMAAAVQIHASPTSCNWTKRQEMTMQ